MCSLLTVKVCRVLTAQPWHYLILCEDSSQELLHWLTKSYLSFLSQMIRLFPRMRYPKKIPKEVLMLHRCLPPYFHLEIWEMWNGYLFVKWLEYIFLYLYSGSKVCKVYSWLMVCSQAHLFQSERVSICKVPELGGSLLICAESLVSQLGPKVVSVIQDSCTG